MIAKDVDSWGTSPCASHHDTFHGSESAIEAYASSLEIGLGGHVVYLVKSGKMSVNEVIMRLSSK